jgi:DNA-binding transcriptional regulator YiaG
MAYSSALLGDDFAEVIKQVRQAQLPPPAQRQQIRVTANLSVRKLAGVLKVAPMTLLRWERGEITPSTENAVRYRAALDALRRAVA